MADVNDMKVEFKGVGERELAQIIHEAICKLNEFIGIPTILWSAMDIRTRDMVTQAVTMHLTGEISSPSQSHDNWVRDRLADGWRLGVLDRQRKTHPNLVPYAELPATERLKDHIFHAICVAYINCYFEGKTPPKETVTG